MTNKHNITIAVDALAISSRSAGGFTVLLGLIREIANLCSFKFVFFTVTKDIENVLGAHQGRFEYIYTPIWAKKLIGRFFWQQVCLPHMARKANCNLIYSASGYPELFCRLPTVTHQQNLWPFAEPQPWWRVKDRVKSFLRRNLAKLAMCKANANVFISDYLRESANKILPSAAAKNFTVHNAISQTGIISAGNTDDGFVKKPFCLTVGSAAIHKNYPALIRAFRQVSNTCPDLHLVIVGNTTGSYGQKVKQLAKETNLDDKIVFTGPLKFERIMKLYTQAVFSVNVSLLEGFGLPVLESMSANCPVVCSNCAAFHEIGGDAVLYCDPYDINDIAEKIILMFNDKVKQNELKLRAAERTQLFSWRKSADNLLKVFYSVLGNNV